MVHKRSMIKAKLYMIFFLFYSKGNVALLLGGGPYGCDTYNPYIPAHFLTWKQLLHFSYKLYRKESPA